MTKWSSYSTSPYLSAGDFEPGEEKRLTIKEIRSELVGRDRENRPVAYFEQRGVKGLVLNKTNSNKLASACGSTTEDCLGADVVLHVVDVDFAGEATQGVRIKSVRPAGQKDEPPAPKQPPADFAPNARARAKQKKPLAQEMDDDIPFAPEFR